MPAIVAIVTVAVFSYLLGSINFAIIISRTLKHEDIRDHGSGNAGMTNMLRVYGKSYGAVTAVLDFLRAILAITLSRLLFNRFNIEFVDAGYIAGLFVMLGQIYPLFFGFRGGKGVMTSLGVMLVLNPIVFLIIVVVFVPIVFITRIVSIASVLGAVAYPIVTFIFSKLYGSNAVSNTCFSIIYSAIILFMHRENIKRLLNGTENKFGQKKR